MSARRSPFAALVVMGLAVLFGGCATLPTASEGTIERFSAAPPGGVRQALEETATARGYVETAPGVFDKPSAYPRDPILGVVQTSETPSQYLRLSIAIEGRLAGSLVTATIATWTPRPTAGARTDTFYWRPGTPAHAEAVELLESATARAEAARADGLATLSP